MKLRLSLILAPLLVQCSTSSASHGSSADASADTTSDGDDGASSSSSGGGADAGSSSGADDSGSGSSGSGSGGGDGAVPTACTVATTPDHLSYTVSNTGGANVLTLNFNVDAVWAQLTPMPAPDWEAYARGNTCPFASTAQLRLGGVIMDADGGDGGITLPSTLLTWTIAGHDYPQSATDAAIWLSEVTNSPMVGYGNYWLSQGGTITGTPIGTAGCYELDFANVPFAKDPGFPKNLNQATGTFLVTGTARIGTGCM